MSVFFINPFAFAAADGDFESIATVTVGSGGAANIEFTSIPGTYQHLQVRLISRTTRSANLDAINIRVGNGGSISSASIYAQHYLYGTGSAATAGGTGSESFAYIAQSAGANATASIFNVAVIEILDYASTTKNKTLRMSGGVDINGSGEAWLASGLWASTNAITDIRVYPNVGPNFAQHTTAALYGIKAP